MASKKKATRFPSWVIVVAIIIVVTLVCGYFFIPTFKSFVDDLLGIEEKESLSSLERAEGELQINFIDVGQGDCILIKLPDGKHMLIDAGTAGDSTYKTKGLDFLNANVTGKKLDYVMLTHADEDHVSFLGDVIKSFEIGTLYIPKFVDKDKENYTGEVISDFGSEGYGQITTVLFSKFFDEVQTKHEQNKIQVKYSETGTAIAESSYRIKIFAAEISRCVDVSSAYKKNAVSPIVILEYAGVKACLTGDATGFDTAPSDHSTAKLGGTESDFVNYVKANDFEDYVDCDVLKLGHHGSRSSSHPEFLKLIKPEYAIAMVGLAEDGGDADYHSYIDLCYTKTDSTKIHSQYCMDNNKTADCQNADKRAGNTHHLPNKDVVTEVSKYTDDDGADQSGYVTYDDDIFATDECGTITLKIIPNTDETKKGTFTFIFENDYPQVEAMKELPPSIKAKDIRTFVDPLSLYAVA